MEGTLGAADRPPRRGGRREAVLEAERPAQAGREAAGFARAGPCWEMEACSALPDALQVPGGLGKGAQASGGAGLSSRRVHELATEGVRARGIGGMVSHPRGLHGLRGRSISCAAKADLVLTRKSSACMASARKVMLLVALSGWAPTRKDTSRQPGSAAIRGCARGSNWSQRRRRRRVMHRASGQRRARRRWKALWAEEARRL